MSETEYPQEWSQRIEPFANAVGKSVIEITDAMADQVGKPTDEDNTKKALDALADKEALPSEEIVTALASLGIPKAILRKNIHLLRGETSKPEAAATSPFGMTNVLPAVPSTESFLELLKTGGILKIGEIEITAAIKAALANRVNMFEIPDRLVDLMDKQTDSLQEPAKPEYYQVYDLLTEKRYAEVLNALNIKKRSFVSETRKKALLSRVEINLWPALKDFNVQLQGWYDLWMKSVSSPGALMMALTQIARGGTEGVAGSNLQAPPTTSVRSAAERVINEINKVFAGHGIPISRALAYDAEKIRETLKDDRLPMLVGASNREQMLKLLEVDVSSEDVLTEQNLIQFAMAVMQLPKIPSGQNEWNYLVQMATLGMSIQWDKLIRGTDSRPDNRIQRKRQTQEVE